MIQKPCIAVVGCGYWGKNLVRNFHELGALAAISDVNPKTAEQFTHQYHVPALSFEDILKQDHIRGIVLAIPAEVHASTAMTCLKSGKHVFVEKPLALRLSDAQSVIRTAHTMNKHVMVGHLLQYHPAFLALKKMVSEGKLGRLQYIYANRLNLGKIRREENVFWSFAPHDISMILSLAGTLPDTVLTTGASYLHQGIDDTTLTVMKFKNGIHAHIYVSWLHPFKEQKLVVIGDQAMAVFDDQVPWNQKLLIYPHKVTWKDGIPEPSKDNCQYIEIEQSEPLKNECQHFLDCVLNNTTPRTDALEGLSVLKVLDASEKSRKNYHEIQVGDLEFSPMLSYFVHESSYVHPEAFIGSGTKIWHFSHIMKGAKIGDDVTMGQNVFVANDVIVGDRCKIQNNVSLYKGVILEDGVFCGPSCVFTNVNNPRSDVERKDEYKTTYVEKGVTIGANATIVCGHRLGAYSFIAAGAVVTANVSSHALMAGVPARRIGWMSHAGEKLGDDLICPREGHRYRITPQEQLEKVEG